MKVHLPNHWNLTCPAAARVVLAAVPAIVAAGCGSPLRLPPLEATFAGGPGGTHTIAVSHDDALLAAAGSFDDTRIRLLRLPDGALLRTLPGLPDPCTTVAFSPNDRLLAGITFGGDAAVWSVRSGVVLQRWMGIAERWRGGIAWAPSGDRVVVSGTRRGGLSVRDVRSGAETGHITWDSDHSPAWDQRTRLLACAGRDRVVHLLEPERATEVGTWAMRPDDPKSVAFSRDGRRLAVGGMGRLVVLRCPSLTVLADIHDRRTTFGSAAFSRDGRWLAAGGWPNTMPDDIGVGVWSTRDWTRSYTLPSYKSYAEVAFSAGGTRLMVHSHELIRVFGPL